MEIRDQKPILQPGLKDLNFKVLSMEPQPMQ